MSARRCLLIAVLVAYAPAAWSAGDDEDDLLAPLAPLTPAENKGKRKKPKKVVPPQAPAKKEPSEPSRLVVRLPDGPSGPLKDARLFLDEKEIGVLPLEPVETTPGDHKVAVKRLGYATFSATVKVKDSGMTELLATLEPLAAVVDFTSDVVGAEVFVDGKSYGPAPVNDVLVAPGSRQFRAKRDGYEEQTQTMAVKAGQDYSVRFALRPVAVARADRPERPPKLEPSALPPEPARNPVTSVEKGSDDGGGTPWYGQWWVWAGTGAVAAGAVAGAIVLQPSNPCAPLAQCDACINEPEPVKRWCLIARHLPRIGIQGKVGP